MTMNDRSALIERWKFEERQPFSGWDFSYLDGRMFEEQAPWSYTRRALELLKTVDSVLDMDTGGGERFGGMHAAWPMKVVATENYPPNLKLARARLEPLGAKVLDVKLGSSRPMPFQTGEFDLVLNRHAAFNSHEVARILTPGGTFFTQQVDGRWDEDLEAIFGAKPKWPKANLKNALAWQQAVGFQIVNAREFIGQFSFTDVGAIVYYLHAVPWLVDGFSVDTHLDGLLALQDRLERGEPLSFRAGKYLIETVKPENWQDPGEIKPGL